MGTSARCLYVVSVISCVAFLLLGECCWTRSRRLEQPTPIRAGDTVWIWSGGKGVRWHDVVITPDSVTGIPYGLPSRCGDCLRSIPLTEVDSIVDVRRGVTQYVAGAAVLYAIFRWVVFNPNVH